MSGGSTCYRKYRVVRLESPPGDDPRYLVGWDCEKLNELAEDGWRVLMLWNGEFLLLEQENWVSW
jgi:hypothetical protein